MTVIFDLIPVRLVSICCRRLARGGRPGWRWKEKIEGRWMISPLLWKQKQIPEIRYLERPCPCAVIRTMPIMQMVGKSTPSHRQSEGTVRHGLRIPRNSVELVRSLIIRLPMFEL